MERTHSEVWGKCLEIIRDNLQSDAYNTWFAPVESVRLEGANLMVKVPSMFFVEYLESHFLDLLGKTLRRVIGPGAQLSYDVVMARDAGAGSEGTMRILNQNRYVSPNPQVSPALAHDTRDIRNPFVFPGLQKIDVDSRLNPAYSFENFMQGDCNKLARAAGLAVAKSPGRNSFNPLFVYGGNGMGKTHLAHAIGIQIRENQPDKVVLCVEADLFQQQYVDATQGNRTTDFVNFYKMIDVLILDDVHVFAQGKKSGTQQNFFNIFNYLHQNNRQLILTSDKAPADLQGLEERLLSRFKWGTVVEIKPPSYETRLEILRHRMKLDGISMPVEVQEYVARQVTGNVREIIGALNSLVAHTIYDKGEITLKVAQDLVSSLVRNNKRNITVELIQSTVCDYYKVTPEELRSRTRRHEIVLARQVAMYFSREKTGDSLASIGASVGGKDHATVLHSCKTIKNQLEIDKRLREEISEIERMLEE